MNAAAPVLLIPAVLSALLLAWASRRDSTAWNDPRRTESMPFEILGLVLASR